MTATRETLAALRPISDDPDAWATRINACWRASVEAIIEVGRLLAGAKQNLDHGQFIAMVRDKCPFQERTAQMLMAIAEDQRLTNAKHVSHLPPSWGTLYHLTKLDDETFAARIEQGVIRPDMERNDIKAALQQERRAQHAARTYDGGKVEALHKLITSGFRAGTILADPPWHFLARSEKGEGRSASQHYTTDRMGEITSLPVKDLAAPDATLIMWMVDWCPKLALEVVEAWGFAHKTTAFTWVKLTKDHDGTPRFDDMITDRDFHFGQGYWTRANPEDAWLATRGAPKRINADVRQLVIDAVMEHSRKPDIYDQIERLVGGPYLELYARRERKGWVSWGNELKFRPPQEIIDPETGEVTTEAA